MLQSRKRYEVLDAVLTSVLAFADFFRQGKKLFDGSGGLGEFTSDLAEEIKAIKKDSASLEKRLEKRHTHISQGDGESSGTSGTLQGYLFKRGQNAFRTWNRRWFYLQVIFSWIGHTETCSTLFLSVIFF